MKKLFLLFTLLYFLPNISNSQDPLKMANEQTYFYKGKGLLSSYILSSVSMFDVNSEAKEFSLVLSSPVGMYGSTYERKTNEFTRVSTEFYGLLDSIGIKFSSKYYYAIYYSKIDKLIIYDTNVNKATRVLPDGSILKGELKEEDIYIKYVLGTDKEGMKKYEIPEEEIKSFIISYESKLLEVLLAQKKQSIEAKDQAEKEEIKRHFEEELEASKTRTLPEWAYEKGFEYKVCKEYWEDGKVLQTWKSTNSRGWAVWKDEYGVPQYKYIYVLLLIKSEDGYCYFIDNTLKMNYEGGGKYGHVYLKWKPSYYEDKREWGHKRMVDCSNIKI